MYLRISKFLETLSFKLRQKALYFELKHYIKQGENYIKPVHSYNRGIGKTYTLIQLAKKYKCPIIVGTRSMEDFIKRLSRDEFNFKVEVFIANNPSRIYGKRFKLALCEEGIDRRMLNEIIRPMCKQIIGYEFFY